MRHLKGLDLSQAGVSPTAAAFVETLCHELPEGNGCLSPCSSGLGSTDASGTNGAEIQRMRA